MTESTGGPLGPIKVPARNNVYTVLIIIAALALAAAVLYVSVRNYSLYSSPFPVVPPANSSPR